MAKSSDIILPLLLLLFLLLLLLLFLAGPPPPPRQLPPSPAVAVRYGLALQWPTVTARSRCVAMLAAETPFVDCWASTVYPAIKGDFDRLLKTTPKRIARKLQKQKAKKDEKKMKAATRPQQKKDKTKQEEKDPVHEKISLLIEEVKETGERRNAYMNLAWTGPIDNTFKHEKISLGKVASMAADMFLRSLDGAVETAPESQEAANDVEAPPQSKAQRPAADT